MRKTVNYFSFCVLFSAVSFIQNSQAAETSFNHTYPAAEWSYQGNDIPETYWTPWLPIGAQQLTRYRIGFRFSTGTIAVKCPVKLTFKYDTANAKSGKDLPIKVKAELAGASYKTFESAFGLHLPNEFQIGFIGITGVPDFLPWYTLPWDLCEILGSIPGVPDAVSNKVTVVCSAIENLGVNMNTQDALPLASEAAYHDTRTLLDLKLTDFMTEQQKTQFVQDVGIKFFNGISSKLGPLGMSNLLLVIRAAKNLNEAGATEFLTDQCISAAGKFVDLANLSVIGDPYFKVEGVELNVLLRMYIPNGKGSGTYPITFTSSGQEQTVTFRDITPFVQTGDKLVIVADSISYRFKLKQCLKPKIKISIFPEFPIDTYEKYITLATAKKDFAETEFKGEIPLTVSTDPIQSLRAQPGCTSAQVNWTSPIVPLKGTIKAYQGNTVVKTLTENTFKAAHNNIITGLNKNTAYRLEVSGVTESGTVIQGGSVTVTTKSDCQPRNQDTTCNSLTFSTNPTATAGQNYIDFSWTTNERASTEVLISPSPDLSANYVACVKKSDGTVNQGWVTQGGVRELVTNHSIRVTDLEPGTKYYFNVVSWTFKNNNPNDNPINRIGYVSEITTQALPAQPSMRISVLHNNQPVSGASVSITKVGDAAYNASVVTPGNGMTESIMLQAGKSYIFKVLDSGCYQDYTSPTISISSIAQGEQPPYTINLLAKPVLGAYVYDTAGRPVSGATASFSGNTATTNSSGYYSFGDVRPQSNVTISVSKAGFLTEQVDGKVQSCGRTRTFTINNCILKKTEAIIEAYVKKQDNSPVSGATVTVKKGSQTLGTASTNSQGKATININLTNPNEQNLTVTATPPSSLSGAAAVSETIKLAPEGYKSVYFTFIIAPPIDSQAPVVSNVSFKQLSKDKIEVFFKANEQVSTVSLEYKFPNGQTKNTNWYTYNSSLFLGNVSSGYTTAISDSSLVEGQYKIRIKCKDQMDNLTETTQYDFTMFGGTLWGLKSTAVTGNSIALSWAKFPNAADFAKYTISPEPGGTTFAAVDITNINQTSHTLNGLQSGKTYKFALSAVSKTGFVLAGKATLSVTTTALAKPIISSFAITPKNQQEAGKNIKVTAKITDSDSVINKVILTAYNSQTETKQIIEEKSCGSNTISYSKTFTLNEPGSYVIYLEAVDSTGPITEKQDYQVVPVSGTSEKEEPVEEIKDKPKSKADSKTAKSASKTGITEEKPAETLEEPKGDISLAVNDLEEPVYAKQKTTLTATIKNDSKFAVTGGRLMFYIDDKIYGSSKSVSLEPGETQKIERSFTPPKTGSCTLKWVLNVPDGFVDSNPENNEVKRSMDIQQKPSQKSSGQTNKETSQLQQVSSSTTTSSAKTSTTTTSKTAEQTAKQTNTNESQTTTTAAPPKVIIKNITLAGEEKSAVSAGKPLKLEFEIESTADITGPVTAKLTLKIKNEGQEFKQEIENLKAGTNTVKWSNKNKLEAGRYTLIIEIINQEPELKARKSKSFTVTE